MNYFFPLKSNNIRYSAAYIAIVMACIPLFNYNLAGRGLFLYLGLGIIVLLPWLGPYRYLDKFTITYLLFAFYDLITFMWAPSTIHNDFSQYLKMIVFVLAIIMTRFSYEEISLIMVGQILMGGIVAIILATSNTTMVVQGEYLTDTSRTILNIGGVQLDPNYTCLMLIPFATFLFKLFFEKIKIRYYILSAILYCIVLFGCLRTGSRGGLIAIIIASLCYFLKKKRAGVKKIVLVIMVILAFELLFPIVMGYLPDSIARRFTLANIAMSGGSGRTEYWINCISHLGDSIFTLLFGHGKGATFALLGMNSHNFFVDVLYNGGIIEFVLLIVFFSRILQRLNKQENVYGISVFVGYIAMSMTVSVGANMFFWTGISLIIILSQYQEVFSSTERLKNHGKEVID